MASGEQQIAALEAQILSESRDPDWSATAEAELAGSLRGLTSQGLSFAEASCSATLCRVTMTMNDPGMGIDAYRPVFDAVDWQSQRFAHVDGDVTHQVRAYFMRDGHPLPGL